MSSYPLHGGFTVKEAQSILEQCRYLLSTNRNVVSLDIGWKQVSGERTSQPALMIGVIQKKTSSQISPTELLPEKVKIVLLERMSSVLNGAKEFDLPTDVEEIGEIVAE